MNQEATTRTMTDAAAKRPLTVAAVAAVEGLELTVISGASGLDRPVRFAHISELEDPAQWLDGGELLITNGMGVPSAPDKQGEYVRALHAKGASGLVIGVRHAPLHAETLQLADDLAFPLLAVPRHVPFLAITRHVVEANYGASEHLFATNVAILEVLRLRAESTSSRWDLLDDLELITGYDLTVVTPAGCSPESGEPLVDRSQLPLDRMAPHDYRILGDGFVIPVTVGTRIAAFVIAQQRPGAVSAGLAAIRHVVTLVGFEMSGIYRDRALRRAVGERLLRQLIERPMSVASTASQLAAQGIRLDDEPVVCALPLDPSVLEELDHRLADAGIQHLIGKDEYVLCLIPNRLGTLESLAEAAGTMVGVSEPVHGPLQMPMARRQAVWALQHDRDPEQTGIARFRTDANFWLPQDAHVLADVVARILGPIRAYDAENGTELLKSLDAYFRHDCRVSTTANALFIHNHTLAYRLRRVEEITKRNLKTLHDQTELWLALQAFAITGGDVPGAP